MRAFRWARNIGYRVRYFLVSAVLTLVLQIPIFVYYQDTFRIATVRDGGSAMNMAITIARFLEEDIENYRALSDSASFAPGDYDEAYYQRMLAAFRHLKDSSEASFVFTERLRDGRAEYILDGEPEDSADFSPLGSSDSVVPLELEAAQMRQPRASELERDPKWGMFVTGYAPIVDPRDDTLVGLVGVDYSAEHVMRLLDKLRLLIYITSAVLFALIMVVMNTFIHRRLMAYGADHVTGLLTKRSFDDQLEAALRDLQEKEACSLAMIDLDNFKEINDLFGHVSGDTALLHAGRTIRQHIRKTDLAARYGGDELLIFFRGASGAQAQAICRRIAAMIEKNPAQADDGRVLSYTLSIGIAERTPGMGARALVAQADAAMYRAKNNGKNQVWLDSPAPKRQPAGA